MCLKLAEVISTRDNLVVLTAHYSYIFFSTNFDFFEVLLLYFRTSVTTGQDPKLNLQEPVL
jgi:hypothetical protein